MENYFFHPVDLEPVGRRDEPTNDDFLFDQGPARGLGKIRFHDYAPVFERFDLPNVAVFAEQANAFKAMLAQEPPTAGQTGDTDWLLAIGEIFTLVVYAQLVLENAEIYGIDHDLVDQIFDVAVRDLSRFAVELHGKVATTPEQGKHCLTMVRKPNVDKARFERVRQDHVYALRDAYEMAE
jgi:acyl-CoA dehydrogenase